MFILHSFLQFLSSGATASLLAVLAALPAFQDPGRTDVTPPNPDDFLVTQQPLAIYESDGGGCKKFDLGNVDANVNSQQHITVTWESPVTGEADPSTTCELRPGQHVIRECHIKRIIVREQKLPSSTHRMSRIKL